MKEFISLNNSGGLGNQVALFVHQLAFCKEQNAALTVCCLEKHQDDFVFSGSPVTFSYKKKNIFSTGFNYFLKTSINTLFKNRSFSFFNTYVINTVLTETDPVYKKITSSKSFTVLSTSWNVRFHQLVNRHQDELRQSVQLSEPVKKNAQAFLAANDLTGESLNIGIHIRRGDYKEFEGGRYFYPLEFYYSVMTALTEKFAGQHIRFIVFSNEKNELENKRNFNIVYSHEQAITDLCIMSQLNLLAGPPSTFSGTASFLGNVPFWELKSMEADLLHPNFCVYEI